MCLWPAWHLQAKDLAESTINNHMASLSGFASWVQTQNETAFVMGDPTKGIGDLPLPPLEPRALDEKQIQSLKNLCDRLPFFYRSKNRKWLLSDGGSAAAGKSASVARPAMTIVLLSTGLRREELVNLNLSQLSPNSVDALRQARRGQINGVVGKGKTQRDVFLSLDARRAIAEYLENEHLGDVTTATEEETPLFLVAIEAAPRRADGRLSPRSVNHILEKIGKWHDAGVKMKRVIFPLCVRMICVIPSLFNWRRSPERTAMSWNVVWDISRSGTFSATQIHLRTSPRHISRRSKIAEHILAATFPKLSRDLRPSTKGYAQNIKHG